MGYGKTTAAINYINSSPRDKKFMFITPYLDEVDRIVSACADKNFRQPDIFGTKLNGIKYLLSEGANIVSSHKLFSMLDDASLEMIEHNGYTLFLDEVADVVDVLEVSGYDMKDMLERYATIDNGMMKWNESNYSGNFEEYQHLAENNCLGVSQGERLMTLKLFPVNIFKAFSESYVMTYLFDAQIQKLYYDFHGIDYSYGHVERDGGDYTLVCGGARKSDNAFKEHIRSLLTVYSDDNLNAIGEGRTTLSVGWYSTHESDIKKLKNNTYNFFKNYTKTSSSYNMWTSFAKYEKQITGSGYTKGFVPCNARATNKYRDRTSVAYLVNRFLNPYVKNFFSSKGITPNENLYALSEMIQWIWRSAIREGNKICAYIPSERMRGILKDWINNDKTQEKEQGDN